MNPPSHHNHRDLSWLDHISQNILIIIGSRKQKQLLTPLHSTTTGGRGKLSSGDNINRPPELLQFIFIEYWTRESSVLRKKFIHSIISRQFWSTFIALRWAWSRKSTEWEEDQLTNNWGITRQFRNCCCNNNRDLLTSLMSPAPTHPIIIITTTRASPEISRHTASDWTHIYKVVHNS